MPRPARPRGARRTPRSPHPRHHPTSSGTPQNVTYSARMQQRPAEYAASCGVRARTPQPARPRSTAHAPKLAPAAPSQRLTNPAETHVLRTDAAKTCGVRGILRSTCTDAAASPPAEHGARPEARTRGAIPAAHEPRRYSRTPHGCSKSLRSTRHPAEYVHGCRGQPARAEHGARPEAHTRGATPRAHELRRKSRTPHGMPQKPAEHATSCGVRTLDANAAPAGDTALSARRSGCRPTRGCRRSTASRRVRSRHRRRR